MKEERYFYVPNADKLNELPQEEAVHATRVLRLGEGDEIFLIDGEGTFYKAEVTLTTNKRCAYTITEILPQQRPWNGCIHIVMAPTKMMERVEWMAEKATEIGFDKLSFLECKFSERRQIRIDRIEKIITAATKQSRKAWIPKVNGMRSFHDFINKHTTGQRYICHCHDEIERSDLFSLLTTHYNNNKQEEDTIILIGPEGDFSVDEVKYAIAHGFLSVSLGSSRLRTETAALSAVMMTHIAKKYPML